MNKKDNIPEQGNKVEKLNDDELGNVNGGGWLSDAWDATCDWCSEHKTQLKRLGYIAGGIALCATGIGIGAAAGLIVVESVGAAAIVSTGVGSIGGTITSAIVEECQKDD